MLIEISLISQSKIKVYELATGYKFTEEWTMSLPTNWQSPVDTSRIIFNKNFVMLEFDTWMNGSAEDDDLLILNLASRKQFWLKKKPLEMEIKARATALDVDGEPYDFDDDRFGMIYSVFRRMTVKQNEIEIDHHMDMDFRFGYDTVLIG